MSALQTLAAGVNGMVSNAAGFWSGVRSRFPHQALAETTPSLTNGWFYGDEGLDLIGRHLTYGALYRAQPSVATLVNKRANATARLTLNVWDTTPSTGKVIEKGTPLARLIERPSTYLDPFSFWRWFASTYDVYGEAYLLKERTPDGTLANLTPMTPTRTVVRRDDDGTVWYSFTIGVAIAPLLTVKDLDVVALQRYNPDSIMRGLSPLEPLRTTLANEDAARRATLSFWKRGARPGFMLEHPSELSQKAIDKLRAQFDARHAGADLTGSTAVLDEGMTAKIMQLNLEEMQYIEARKLDLQEVCMVYDVPPPVVHILDHATFSNISEQMRSMYRDTMAPLLEDIESTLNETVVREFYPDGSRRVSFNLDEVLRGDFEVRAEAVTKLVTNGIMKPAEARPLFDLPDAGEIADGLYANQALQPLGTPVSRTTVTEAAPRPLEPVVPGEVTEDALGDPGEKPREMQPTAPEPNGVPAGASDTPATPVTPKKSVPPAVAGMADSMRQRAKTYGRRDVITRNVTVALHKDTDVVPEALDRVTAAALWAFRHERDDAWSKGVGTLIANTTGKPDELAGILADAIDNYQKEAA